MNSIPASEFNTRIHHEAWLVVPERTKQLWRLKSPT